MSEKEIVHRQLEKAREDGETRALMRLAGTVRGPHDLSSRKGFSTDDPSPGEETILSR